MNQSHEKSRAKIQSETKALQTKLYQHLQKPTGLCLIKAPPGSGKTYILTHAVRNALEKSKRVAVAAQTNAQSDDICLRLATMLPKGTLIRLLKSGGPDNPVLREAGVLLKSSPRDIPNVPSVSVATTAKWSLSDVHDPFDLLFVDEAWQMSWADFMPLQQVSGNFVLIGDPGQIPPVVSIDTQWWATSYRPPHLAAPSLLENSREIDTLQLELPACRRLPHCSVDRILPFYDFHFAAWAKPGARYLRSDRLPRATGQKRLAEQLVSGSVTLATLPTDSYGPPPGEDRELAAMIRQTVDMLLNHKFVYCADDENTKHRLTPANIGITATHRKMNHTIAQALQDKYETGEGGIRIDTPERWQGLERPVMIAVHPLSGVHSPSEFDLETGRLCVMASRHQTSLIIFSRNHVGDMLDRFIPTASQPLMRPDICGRGHHQHLEFWSRLLREERHVELGRL